MAIPSISDGQPDRKPVSDEWHKIILAKVQKGYKLLLKKIKSAFPVKMHIYTLHPTKYHEILLGCFRGVGLTNCWSSIFNFVQISKRGITPRKKVPGSIFIFVQISKRGITPRKKKLIRISCGYAPLHIKSFITTKCQVTCFFSSPEPRA